MFPDSPFPSRAAGTTGAAFLKLARPARSEALGGAFAADSEGADALLTNPAGLTSLQSGAPSDLSFAYNNLLESSYLGYGSYGRSLGRFGTVAAGVIYFSQAPLTGYNARGDASGSFQPYDVALSMAYARQFEGFAVGAAAKMIRSSIDDVSGMSAALDVGVQAKDVSRVGEGAVDAGASFSNLGPPLKVGGVAAPLPFALTGGFLWHATPAFNAMLDVNLPSDNDPYVSFGLQAQLWSDREKRALCLRVGYNQSHGRDIDGLTGLTAGAGFDLVGFRLDYAWDPYGDLGMQNRVTLAFRF